MYDDSSYLILCGFIAIIIGFLIIGNHNIWEKNWTVMVTIIGWIALFEGILLLIFPKYILIFKPIMTPKNINIIIIPIAFIVGLVFAYFGFILN